MDGDDLTRAQRERDLYLRLLQVGEQNDLGRFLKQALSLLVEITGARQGYLEVGEDDTRDERCSIADGFSDDEVQAIRSSLSSGIIAEALATGRTIVTASALLDPRFRERGSVQVRKIEAVLCAPVGAESPLGVLYLQGRSASGPFSADDQANAEIFARHLAPFARRLLAADRQRPDPTRALRDKLRVAGIAGKSRALADLLQQVALVAPIDVTVLLTGDSGTGKTIVARAIHDNGPRAAYPFIELNGAALPDELVESELFGAMPGAHSTATKRVEGKVAAAEKGTLFLDEVGDLSMAAQAKILHLLQSKSYFPLGSSKPLSADVRVIAATNVDLRAAVADKRFREDLFYRLQVMPIRVPSLAERRDDIEELIAHFLAAASERHRLPRLEASAGTLRAALAAAWPGNVRELEHACEAALIRAAGQGASQIELAHLLPAARSDGQPPAQAETFQHATRRFQTELLRSALVEADWNVSEVAKKLDVARSHLYSLIRSFGIER